ncbi:MAG TPA: chemotaxis protein CheW [Anaerohalosphaeraceae bacterium]|jgi:purine-binding chemotaxis protein CheW|nr:chemotaxis protein CheW [Anaerohalosphaeraceae bacterium]
MTTATVTETKNAGLEGKYLTFALGQEQYGIGILKVREIIGYVPITPMPRTPSYIKGVVNLRGQVIPVLDLRLRFEMPAADVTEQTCIIVVEVSLNNRMHHAGLIVDRVQEVLYVEGKDIEQTPQLGAVVRADFILGIGKADNGIKVLLDIDRVVQSDAVAQLTKNQPI